MDRNDIIRMARKAGFEFKDRAEPRLEIFAALVAAREREAIIEILSSTEFTSIDHMPSEAALIIRLRSNNGS